MSIPMGSYGNSYGFLRQFLWVPMDIPMGSYEHSYGEKLAYSFSPSTNKKHDTGAWTPNSI